MRVRFLPLPGCLSVGVLALFAVNSSSFSQTSAELGIQVVGGYPQVSVNGPAGSSWAIQYASDATPSAGWLAFTNVTLSTGTVTVLDPTGPLAEERFYRALELQSQMPTNVLVTNMVWMSSGTFTMGSPLGEVGRQPDETQHQVTLTQGFFVGQHLVTQRDYLSVVSNNPSGFNGIQGGTDYGMDLDRPVESVYWFWAVDYCAQMTQIEQQAGHLPAGWVYRLPTEAEWEYSCRAGTTNRFSFGDDPNYVNLPNYAWFSGNSANITHAVGQKLSNPAGLYDVHGDVYEWCQDYYGVYRAGPATDPQGPTTGTVRVFRGGSWQYGGAACRSAGRYQADPTSKFNFLGFRVVVARAGS